MKQQRSTMQHVGCKEHKIHHQQQRGETATFNDTTCTWDVTGTQEPTPTTVIYETATFNDTTCT
jgi:sterol desaturase/sphingolipid hydroxylase (fatty acid hydroxylase superfamily)